MARHYVTLNRGQEGSLYSDFVTGVATSATALFEFSVLDGGGTPKKAEVIKALEAFKRFIENPQQVAGSGFDIAG